ncbi:MAG: sulfite exporter TauE/SafE family protein [Clostridiales bacterium]|nr:sulfite exporter TauE/SafE family protein [Clostridiales bacterium]
MREVIKIGGMKCSACENRIEAEVGKISGVKYVKADCVKNTLMVKFELPADIETVKKAVKRTGYDVSENKADGGLNTLYILVIILGLYIIARQTGLIGIFQKFPTVGEEKIGYTLLFITGLFTSVHCIAMCSGINLAQSAAGENEEAVTKSLLYNLGRLTGYTLVGAVLGLLGEAVSITLKTRAVIGIAAGVFMILTGINMLGSFGFIKKLTLRLPKSITYRVARLAEKGSFAIGVVNALMPCGPLQSMQLYAIASGSLVSGALSMFFFCLGTIPLMFVFGVAAGALKNSFRKIFMQTGAVLILIFGIYMLQNNFALSGINILTFSKPSQDEPTATEILSDGKQYVSTELKPNSFSNIEVKTGVPLVWTLTAAEDTLNGCNNELVIPEYNIKVKLKSGENIIEFTPNNEGTFTYTCWMGMIKNTVTVID